MTNEQKQAVEEAADKARIDNILCLTGNKKKAYIMGAKEVINNPQSYGLQPINEWVSVDGLRKQFQNETGIAPVFANRTPYINYIKWLEDKLASMTPINEREEGYEEGNNNHVEVGFRNNIYKRILNRGRTKGNE